MTTKKSSDFDDKKCLFALKFPNYKEEEIPTIDAKHQRILEALASSSDWLADLKENEIRTWRYQDDIGHTPYLMDYLQRDGSSLGNLLKFLFHKTKYAESAKAIRDSILDDIGVIENRWGSESLVANPVNGTPGKPKFSKINGYFVNTRWMRYLYLANVIRQSKLIPENGVWVDVGSYFGGLQGLVYKNFKKSKFILVDFHHQLFRSYVYLSQLYPNAQHNLGLKETLADTTTGSFNYVHVSDFQELQNLNIDLLSNFFSFGEMSRETFEGYRDSDPVKLAKNIYLVNRFVSAPYFEKTYHNDLSVLDYKFENHQLYYFDVFPIHHFAAFHREIFGRARLRNTSSSYFEMILSIKE